MWISKAHIEHITFISTSHPVENIKNVYIIINFEIYALKMINKSLKR